MPGIIEAYRAHLPVTERTPPRTRHEGTTPRVHGPGRAAHRGVGLFR